MVLRNIIELLILFATAVMLIPLYIMKREEVKDLDGFEVVEKDDTEEDDSIVEFC